MTAGVVRTSSPLPLGTSRVPAPEMGGGATVAKQQAINQIGRNASTAQRLVDRHRYLFAPRVKRPQSRPHTAPPHLQGCGRGL